MSEAFRRMREEKIARWLAEGYPILSVNVPGESIPWVFPMPK